MSEPTTNQLKEELKVEDFFLTALEDEALLNKLETALDAKDDAAILNLAQQSGYNFSQSALDRGLQKIANLIVSRGLTKEQ